MKDKGAALQPAASARLLWLEMLVVGALLLTLCVLMQQTVGAYTNDYGTDEAAHFVTGLMIRDFLVSGDYLHPVQFAKDFYLHYPKVGLGHWPPLLYLLLGGWMTVFGSTRLSAIACVACLTALLALLSYATGRRLLGRAGALTAALLVIATPLAQEASARVMPEHFVNLLMLLSALQFAKYMRTGRAWDSLLFGLLATAAILTRGTGWALAFVPPVMVLLSARYDLLRRPASWLPLAPVLLLAVPWYLATRSMMEGSWLGTSDGLPFWLLALGEFSRAMVIALGAPVLLLAAVGIWIKIARPWRLRQIDPVWAALLALMVAVLLLHCLLPVGTEARYMLPLIPSLALFAVAGVQDLSNRLVRRLGHTQAGGPAMTAACALLLLVFGLQAFGPPPGIRASGFGEAARLLQARTPAVPAMTLIASDPRGEGSLIASVAASEPRPRSVVLRGSKILVKEDWFGRNSEDLYDTPERLSELLDRLGVSAVVVDESTPAFELKPYHQRLGRLMKERSAQWRLLTSLEVLRADRPQTGRVLVYERIDPAAVRGGQPNLVLARELMKL